MTLPERSESVRSRRPPGTLGDCPALWRHEKSVDSSPALSGNDRIPGKLMRVRSTPSRTKRTPITDFVSFHESVATAKYTGYFTSDTVMETVFELCAGTETDCNASCTIFSRNCPSH